MLVGALVSGKLATASGRARVMHARSWVYGIGLLVPFVSTVPWVVALAAPLVAFGGGVTMSLPYALLMPMMPTAPHGALSGFYSLSRGIGTVARARCSPAWPSRWRGRRLPLDLAGVRPSRRAVVSTSAVARLRDEHAD